MNKDDTPLTFGKHKGKTPAYVADIDPSYVVWMFDNVTPKPCSKKLRNDCEQDAYDEEEQHAMDAHYGVDGWGEF